MTWLAPKLSKRVQIGKPIQAPNDEGGFDLSFNTLLTVWMGMKPVTFKGSKARYLRGEQINENISHEFTVRRIAVAQLGKAYVKGFSIAFDSIEDLSALKSDYFLFLQQDTIVKGRLFRVHGFVDKDERREYLVIDAEEIEERGSGWTE